MGKKKFLGQYTFYFFAYYRIEVTLTSNKAVLPLFFFNLSSSPLSFQTSEESLFLIFLQQK